MKTYKINNKEITEQELNELIAMKNKKSEGRFFFPEEGEKYYIVYSDGCTGWEQNIGYEVHKRRIVMGVYKTEEQAKKALERQKAVVAMWEWCHDNNVDTDVTWGYDEWKYYPVYRHEEDKWYCESRVTHQFNFELPHFKSQEACANFIKHNTELLQKLL